MDNGSTFVSLQTERILNTVQIHLVHSTPHRPQGRGKIERFMRTIRDGFLRPLNIASVTGFDDLNLRFRTWRQAEYHRNPHHGINGQTPLEAWIDKARHIKTFSGPVDLERVFYHECHRTVGKDQTITVNGTLFEAPSNLIGKKVTLRYDPHKPRNQLEIWYDGKDFGIARMLDRYANTKVRRSTMVTRTVIEDDTSDRGSIRAGLIAAGMEVHHEPGISGTL